MNRHDRARLEDIAEAISTIRGHLERGDLHDGFVYDAVGPAAWGSRWSVGLEYHEEPDRTFWARYTGGTVRLGYLQDVLDGELGEVG